MLLCVGVRTVALAVRLVPDRLRCAPHAWAPHAEATAAALLVFLLRSFHAAFQRRAVYSRPALLSVPHAPYSVRRQLVRAVAVMFDCHAVDFKLQTEM